jgi:putative membrane protein
MVKLPTPLESDAIAKAVRQVENQTGVIVATVIAPISHSYLGYAVLDTFLFAALINGALWLSRLVVNVESMLIIQAALMLFVVLPTYRLWVVSLLPKTIRHHHAARSAVMAFHHVLHQTPADKHVVLLYVSLAERYVHILHSRTLNDIVAPEIWKAIVAQFTATMPKIGLSEATLQAIKNIESALVGHE